jgi:hypothetical protein
LLSDQLIHALHRLGWVTMPDTILPSLDRRTPVTIDPDLDSSEVGRFRQRYLSNLSQAVDFAAIKPEQTRALLGGVFPETGDAGFALKAAPWASLRAAFLLRRPDQAPLRGVEVQIEIPARAELFPFPLRLQLDGARVADTVFEQPNQSGRYRIAGAPKVPPFYDRVVEVTLETSSYFSTIDDARMKSYRLLHARAY